MRRGARVIGTAVAAAVVTCLWGFALPPPAVANEVVHWNETTMKFIEANGQNTIVSTRTLAMVHGAIHDALNAINRRYDAYYFEGPADAGRVARRRGRRGRPHGARRCRQQLRHARPEGRRAGPRRAGLCRVDRAASPPAPPGTRAWPSAAPPVPRCSRFARMTGSPATRPIRRAWVPASGGRIRTPSRQPAHRQSGRWLADTSPRSLPGWGNVTPFTLLSASQFWLAGPPALTSATYARDYNEVKSVGGKVSTVRTARPDGDRALLVRGPRRLEHASRARWPTSRGLDARDSARVLALMNMAMADALHRRLQDPLCVRSRGARSPPSARATTTATMPPWATRPGTVIRTPLPSLTIRPRKARSARAAAVVLASVLGGDQANFTVTSGKPFEGITRSFTSFSQAARESADSRVYAGIHFRSACEDGLALGRKIGQRAVTLYLQPARK